MSNLIYLIDRSGEELDDRCGMAYWWNRIENGKGIVSKREALPLLVGRETHQDMAALGIMEDISPSALQSVIDTHLTSLTEPDTLDQFRMEMLYRRLGWLAAWGLFMEPRVREDYSNVSVEQEIVLNRDPLFMAVTPDRLLRHRKESYLVYKEFKSTITASFKWLKSWNKRVQIHSSLKAIEEELGERPKFGQIVGLLKGDYRDGRLAHPYVWGYWSASRNQWESSYERARGSDWTHMPVWEYPGGVVEWVQKCGPEVAQSQFPHTMPIFMHDQLLEEWIETRKYRQMAIREVKQSCRESTVIRNVYFPKRTQHCEPAFGDACPYLLACWNASAGADPLGTGEYEPRTPHHPIELMLEGD